VADLGIEEKNTAPAEDIAGVREMASARLRAIHAKILDKIDETLEGIQADTGPRDRKDRITAAAIALEKELLVRTNLETLDRQLGHGHKLHAVAKPTVIELKDITAETPPKKKRRKKEGTHDE
jgi:hypothetical protein